jgi:hypothetical protein
LTIEVLIKSVPVTEIFVLPDPAKADTGDMSERVGSGFTRVRVADPDLVESDWLTAVIGTVFVPDETTLGAV